MKKYNYLKIIILSLVFTLNLSGQDKNNIELTGIIHVHSIVSPSGRYSFDEIAKKAKEKNIDIIIFTDHALTRAEYGLFPFRNLYKNAVEYDSVMKLKPSNYLEQIKRTNDRFPEMILIPGVEAAPFYYWTGSILGKDLTLNDWDKHILAVGLENSDDYLNMPLISNIYRTKHRGLKIILLWPLLFLSLSILIILRSRSSGLKIAGVISFVLFLLAIANNYPFEERYDQYKNENGMKACQTFIDYVNDKGGLSFWAHPEVLTKEGTSVVKSITNPHPEDIEFYRDYTGFAALETGYDKIARPAGLWDKVLREYCEGTRRSPVWAIAELDYTSDKKTESLIDANRFVIRVSEKSKKACIEALKKGKFYNITGLSEQARLSEFSILGISSETARSGETLKTEQDSVNIKVKVISLNKNDKRDLVVKIIKNGMVFKVSSGQLPHELDFSDKLDSKKAFYRLELWLNNRLRILSNPIFVN